MKKIFAWLFTVIFFISFGFTLLVSHIMQVILLPFGYKAHKFAVDGMVGWLTHCLRLTGAKITIDKKELKNLPQNRSLIIISNHQSMFDIPFIGYVLKKHHPKYIAKVELANGFPAISYNLRHGGSLVIDRKKPKESVMAIKEFGDGLEKNNRTAVIFPEGTRSRKGEIKLFKTTGIIQLMQAMPSALIVPVAIGNFWKLGQYNFRPIPFGIELRFSILKPIERKGLTYEEVIRKAKDAIVEVAE